METKVLLEDGISIGGKPLRELYEAVNHRNAYRYVKQCVEQRMPLDEKIVKDIYAMLIDHILPVVFTGMWMCIFQEHSIRRRLPWKCIVR